MCKVDEALLLVDKTEFLTLSHLTEEVVMITIPSPYRPTDSIAVANVWM